MALQERSGDSIGAASEPPRNLETSWLQVGRVVYGWTDRRDPGVDRVWWRLQRVRVHNPVPAHLKARDDAANTTEVSR